MDRQFERAERQLEEELASGEIDLAEFNWEMRELERDYRDAAEDAAEQAYSDEMGRW